MYQNTGRQGREREAFYVWPAYPAISRSVLKDRQRVRPARKEGLLILLGTTLAPEPEEAATQLMAVLLASLLPPPTPMTGLESERCRVSEMACTLRHRRYSWRR